MMPGARIRHISRLDWDAVAALEASAYADSGLSEGRAALESRARVSPATCFIVEVGRQMAGYVLSLPYPRFRWPDLARVERTPFISRNLHLHDLVIADGFRRGGLGTYLLDHLTATARSNSYERISLVSVGSSGTFWCANGYHPHADIALPASYGPKAMYMSRAI
jgi:ribosomal protein S18 acetylase RimI-like enzyme